MKARLTIFDMDGTLFRGEQPLPHAVELVAQIRAEGRIVRFLTNNSTLTTEAYAAKLGRMGFDARTEEIASSATGTAQALGERYGEARVFVVGEPGLRETLVRAGHRESDPPDAVIVGMCKSFSYGMLDQALQRLLRGADLIATNADATYPLEGGTLCPGAGSLVAAVATAAGREPFVVGKPNPFLVEHLMAAVGVGPEETLCVGDRVDTDIVCGQRAGTHVHLVLTGVTHEPPPGIPWSADLSALLSG